jgi:hypothetical protein
MTGGLIGSDFSAEIEQLVFGKSTREIKIQLFPLVSFRNVTVYTILLYSIGKPPRLFSGRVSERFHVKIQANTTRRDN